MDYQIATLGKKNDDGVLIEPEKVLINSSSLSVVIDLIERDIYPLTYDDCSKYTITSFCNGIKHDSQNLADWLMLKSNNIKTMENERKQALRQLHLDFFKELQETGLGFHPELRGIINANSISLGIVNPKEPDSLHWVEFASDVDIYVAEKNIVRDRPAEINYGSSGSFSPDVQSQYWKTKHACIILDNWELIQGICSKYCARYVAEFQK